MFDFIVRFSEASLSVPSRGGCLLRHTKRIADHQAGQEILILGIVSAMSAAVFAILPGQARPSSPTPGYRAICVRLRPARFGPRSADFRSAARRNCREPCFLPSRFDHQDRFHRGRVDGKELMQSSIRAGGIARFAFRARQQLQ